MDCGTFHKQKSRLRNSGPGTDASAFHGRQGAQVALLQSPILLAALPAYTKIKNSQAVPLTNHTPVYQCWADEPRLRGSVCRSPLPEPVERTCGKRQQQFTST